MHVTVFASSSPTLGPSLHAAARTVAQDLAADGHTLVYGGNRQGLMSTLADTMRTHGGRVVGITPALFVDRGLADDLADELVVTADMAERKRLLVQRADAFVVLPGGFGTLEEVFDTVVGFQLDYHRKPLVLVDVDGFWEPLGVLFEHLETSGMTHPGWRDSLRFVRDPARAVATLVGAAAG